MYSPEYEDTLSASPCRKPIRNIRSVARDQSKRNAYRTEQTDGDERTPYELAREAEDRAA